MKHQIKYSGEAVVIDGKKYETFESFYNKCVILGEKILAAQENGGIPKISKVLLMPRGSLLVADAVARILKLRGHQVLSIGFTSYDGEVQSEIIRIGQQPTIHDIQNEVVLVLDEVCDSAKTLRVVTQLLNELNAKQVITATVDWKPKNSDGFKPDFYIEEVDQWVVYPGEVLED